MSLEMTFEAFKARVLGRMEKGLSFLYSLHEVFDEYQAAEIGEASVKPACQDRCSVCCHQLAWISRDEMELIWRYLESQSSRERAMWQKRVREIAKEWRVYRFRNRYSKRNAEWHKKISRDWLGKPCPFLLEGGSCGVYPVRPIVCRATTSPRRCETIEHLSSGGQYAAMGHYQAGQWMRDLKDWYDKERGQETVPFHEFMMWEPTRL